MRLRIIFASVLGLFSIISVRAETWAEIQKTKTLRLATDGTFSPFNFHKGTELTGFEVELAEAVATKLGLKFSWKVYPFDSLLIGLSQNRFDLVAASHGVTAERQKAVDFTIPHYCSGVAIMSKEASLSTLDALKGKNVAIQVGTIFVPRLVAVPGIKNVRTLPRDTDCLQALLAGRVDAWVSDVFVGKAAAKAQPDAKLFVSAPLLIEKIAMAVQKGNDGLRSHVDGALRELVADGTYLKLSLKYFGEDISCK
ncbi:MAG: ABC transporter substrate-binding protein [Bdellovibrionota bacterium]